MRTRLFLCLCLASSLFARDWEQPVGERKSWWNYQTDRQARVFRDELTLALKHENWSALNKLIPYILSEPEFWTNDPVRGVTSSHHLALDTLKNLPAERKANVQTALDLDATQLLAKHHQDPDGEEESLRKVITRYPDSPAALDAMKLLMHKAMDYGDSRSVVHFGALLLAAQPGNTALRVILARAHTELGNTTAADAVLKPALESVIEIGGTKTRIKDINVAAQHPPSKNKQFPEQYIWDQIDQIVRKPQSVQPRLVEKLARELTRPALEILKKQLESSKRPQDEDRLEQVEALLANLNSIDLHALAEPKCVPVEGKIVDIRPMPPSDEVVVRTDKKVVLVNRDQVIRSMDIGGFEHVTFSADGNKFSALHDHKVEEFDVRTMKPLRVFFTPAKPLTTLNYSSNGKYLLAGDKVPTIFCFETQSGDKNLEIKVRTFAASFGDIRSLDFQPVMGSIHALFVKETRAKVSFDIIKGDERGLNGGGEAATFATSELKFSPSGHWLAEKNHNKIRINDYQHHHIFRHYEIAEDSNLTGIHFTHDDLTFGAITDKGELYLWPNVESKAKEFTVAPPQVRSFSQEALTSLAFSPTELFFAKAGQLCRTDLYPEQETVTIRPYARRLNKPADDGALPPNPAPSHGITP